MESVEVAGSVNYVKDEGELVALQRELESTKETMKAQLQEAKQKAKNIIQKNMEESQKEIAQLQEKIGSLQDKLSQTQGSLQSLQDESKTTKDREISLESNLQTAQSRILELEKMLKDSSASEEKSRSTSEEVTKLQTKVKDLEEQLELKQQDVNKTREKAKQMLKEINNEKSELEAQHIKETESLKKRVSQMEEAVRSNRRENDQAEKELGAAMATINDLQTTMRTERVEGQKAKEMESVMKKKLEMLEGEFIAHKERARAALSEKEEEIRKLKDGTRLEEEEIQHRIGQEHARAEKLAAKLADLGVAEHNLKVAEERCKAMEDRIAELTKSKTEFSAEQAKRESKLKDEIQNLKEEVAIERGRASAADSRNAQTRVRLNVLEKSLTESEENARRLVTGHESEVAEIKKQVQDIEAKWKQDKQAADAAKRTVEAAMKAYSAADDKLEEEESKAVADDGNTIAELKEQLQDAEKMNSMYEEQLSLLKTEIRSIEAREERASRLSDDLQYDYLKNVIIRFIETDDLDALLPVLANVLSMTPSEIEEVKSKRAPKLVKKRSSILGVFGAS